MVNSAKSRIFACLGLSLIVVFVGLASAHAGLFDIFKFKGHKTKQVAVPRRSLLVFPFDQEGVKSVPEKYGTEVAAYLRTMLAGNPKYAVFLFSDRLSPIRRGLGESPGLKAADIAGPFSEDKVNALKLARLCAADYLLVGSVDAFQYDPSAKVAQMTLSGELVDTKTGKSMGTYVVTGKADESSKASGEDEYRAVAAGKAVDALKEQILPAPAPKAEEAKAPVPEASAPGTAAPTNTPPAEPDK